MQKYSIIIQSYRMFPSFIHTLRYFKPHFPQKSALIGTTPANLRWLHAAELIKFKLATLTFRCLQGSTLHYLSADAIRVGNVPSRRRLRSSSTMV